ncbi:MAG: response regulator transcription factor [Chitinophagaceae bacterium]
MKNKIDVVIIEDSLQLRETIVDALHNDSEINSIQEFGSVNEFLWGRPIDPIPNVMLLDVNLPKIKGTDAIPNILLDYPELNIIIFSINSESADILHAMSNGAVGYIHKTQQSIDDVIHAIKIVRDGGSYLSPLIARRLVNLFQPSRIAKQQGTLTQREEQVLNGLCKGLTYREIADELNVSIDTVRTHIKKIYAKLNVNSKSRLISKVQNIFDKIQ